jgi:hypothetical protein
MQHDHHTDHELKVIGSICTSWASLEYLVDETALHLRRKEKKLGATEDEKLRMTFQRRLKIMKELALKYIESCYHNELEELCKKLGANWRLRGTARFMSVGTLTHPNLPASWWAKGVPLRSTH